MDREELIKKWLDDALNAQELDAFKRLEDYDALIKLSDRVKQFKAPEYDVDSALSSVKQKLHTNTTQTPHWSKYLIRIAAIFVVGFSLYYYTTTLDTTINTIAAQKTSIELPDASSASLNALTTLTYNKKSWHNNREVFLDGEAFFKVSKGATFNVVTPSGTVTVLGTKFNVKQRDNLFEVVCFEGSVEVTYKKNKTILKPNHSFLIIDGEIIATEKENKEQPNWVNNESSFKSMPYKFVLKEFERQYNVKVNTKRVDLNQLYTGNFSHLDKDLALKAITLPLNLKYSIKENSVVLTRE